MSRRPQRGTDGRGKDGGRRAWVHVCMWTRGMGTMSMFKTRLREAVRVATLDADLMLGVCRPCRHMTEDWEYDVGVGRKEQNPRFSRSDISP